MAAHRAAFIPSVFGFTPRAETRVWEEREMAEHMIYFCMHNGFCVVFRDQTVRLNRGDFIWIMPHVANETRLIAPHRPFRTYYLRFSLRDRRKDMQIRLPQDFVYRSNAWNLLSNIRSLVQDLQSPRPFHERRNRASLVLVAASALEEETRQQGSVLTAQQRLAVGAYIETNAAEKVTPHMLADEAGLSMPYFSRIFHNTYGMAPKHWIMRQRVMAAALILSQTQLTAKQVAYRLGYRDRFLFSRQVKEVMGISTRQFRRGIGDKPALEKVPHEIRNFVALKEALVADRKERRRRARSS